MLQAGEPCSTSAPTHAPAGVCVSADYTGALVEARALAAADGRTAASLDVLLGLLRAGGAAARLLGERGIGAAKIEAVAPKVHCRISIWPRSNTKPRASPRESAPSRHRPSTFSWPCCAWPARARRRCDGPATILERSEPWSCARSRVLDHRLIDEPTARRPGQPLPETTNSAQRLKRRGTRLHPRGSQSRTRPRQSRSRA